MKDDGVYIQGKSTYQKDGCLFCEDDSWIEAVCGTAHIRCCDDPDCIQKAREMAKKNKGV